MAYSAITKPTLYFNTKTYTGTGYSLALTGVGFQPDFTWIKTRTAGSGTDHVLFDVLRGVQVAINSNDTSANDTISNSLTAFGTDGFTVNGNGATGANGDTYVGWNWKAGGAGSTNNDGNVASTVSVNSTSGFSIVQWNGTTNNKTIGHGLGVIPSVVIAKNTGGSGHNWIVYHKDLDSGYYIKLNLTNPQDNGNAYFTSNPTNSILSLTGDTAMNKAGNSMIAYCFADKKGYSKFGSYTGNASADGPFVYTGFKPAWIMFKATNSTTSESWIILDTVRQSSNVNNRRLRPDTTGLEDNPSANNVDLLSNGFKLRSSDNRLNGNGHKLIYFAFAAEPLVANVGQSIPATAR
jgi:hypothetical protein